MTQSQFSMPNFGSPIQQPFCSSNQSSFGSLTVGFKQQQLSQNAQNPILAGLALNPGANAPNLTEPSLQNGTLFG